MTPFEEELKQALTRREPGADFTERVLEQVNRKQPRKAANPWAWLQAARTWRLAAVAAAVLVMSGSAMYEHDRVARGQAAKEKLLMAVRIAGAELHQVHRHVLEVEATEENQ
ncbi:MAG TPA: hypothetical protein VMF91_08655 [Bryobacteraceae bacterium]|nr:hypothetical protein [Bryobacteraceae bacterium]